VIVKNVGTGLFSVSTAAPSNGLNATVLSDSCFHAPKPVLAEAKVPILAILAILAIQAIFFTSFTLRMLTTSLSLRSWECGEALINALASVPISIGVLLTASCRKVMGKWVIGRRLKMLMAAVATLVTLAA